jgi:hypothetical protein
VVDSVLRGKYVLQHKKVAKRFGWRGVKAVILHPQPGKEGFAERESTLR